MSNPRDPFEDDVTRALGDLVRHEQAPADLVARAQARMAARRNATRVAVGSALVAAAAVAVAFVVVTGDGGPDREVQTAGDPRGVASTTSIAGEEDIGPTTTLDVSAVTTTTTPYLRDDVIRPDRTEPPPERRCTEGSGGSNGVSAQWDERFRDYWTTQPEYDEPLTFVFCLDDATPKVGQVVTATIVADDPDEQIRDKEDACAGWWLVWTIRYPSGQFPYLRERCDRSVHVPDEPGPAPDPGTPGHLEVTTTFTYEEAGDFILYAGVRSGQDSADPQPYASEGSLPMFIITVHQ